MRIFLIVFFLGFIGLAQQAEVVDFLKIQAVISLDASEKSVSGSLTSSFIMLKAADSIYLDGINMRLEEAENSKRKIFATTNKIWMYGPFMAGEEYEIQFSYEAYPKQALYFVGNQIWTQGQGKYTSHWLPSVDDMNDKIEFDLTFLVPENKTVISNGLLKEVRKKEKMAEWQFDMQQPMSSYLVAIAVGNFEKETRTSETGIPIELYYDINEVDKIEPTYRYTTQIFDFLESEIGYPYPWQNYKEVPLRNFLYAGMENTTAAFFSEAFVVDSIGFFDRNYVNVNAHELAHQWFGNLVTEKEGSHHWLHEGFASYYALLAERQIFGEDYYYWKLYNSAEQLKELSDKGEGESLLNPKASSLTFYEKGTWALHILKEKIGEQAFKTAVANYLKKHQFKNVTIADFLVEVKAASEVDISRWEADWLQQSAFRSNEAYESLIKSAFIRQYFELVSLRTLDISDKLIQLKTALTFPNDFLGQEAIYQLSDELSSEIYALYTYGFESNNLYVRQAISATLSSIPAELQAKYESLLDDKSYVTQEQAMYQLWVNFPERQKLYLDKMSTTIGFQNKNVRQLWLVLALVTKGYLTADKAAFKEELITYTQSDFSFEIRELAFNYIYELQLYDAVSLRNLVQATTHHNWRFREFARAMLTELLKNKEYEAQILLMLDAFTVEEQAYIKLKIGLK